MSNALTIEVRLTGVDEVASDLQALRNGLTRRGPLHAKMAVRGKQFTQAHLRGLDRHKTAERLGAKATGHHNKAAASVGAQSDEDEALIVIPRRTGLGRAFGNVVLRPGSGRKYLTIPAHKRTYGRSARDARWGDDPFQFVLLGRYRALIFKDGEDKGEVAYWLKREVSQKQDRSLLPSDAEYMDVGNKAATEFFDTLLRKGGARA